MNILPWTVCFSVCIGMDPYIILESKYFIYRCKLNKGCLCVRLLVDKFKKTFQTERFIAKRNNKIHFHDKKWKPLLPLIQQ